MQRILIIIIVIILSHSLINPLVITYSALSNSYNLIVTFSSVRQKYFEININAPFNWAIEEYYDKSGAIFYENQTVYFDGFGIIQMEKLSDLLIIEEVDIKIEKFYFYYSNLFLHFNSISFAHKFNDISHSLVHTLYKNKQIKSRNFAIFPPDNSSNGELYIGETTFNLHSEYKYKTSCKAIDDINEWGCKMNEFIIGNKHYNATPSSYFKTNERRILVPKYFMDILKEIFFNKYIESRDCSVEIRFNYHSYICSKQLLNEFPNITFVMENSHLTFEPNEIVFATSGRVKFLIEENDFEDTWVFGIAFFKKYPVYFSYDDNIIAFYSKTKFPYSPESSNSSINFYIFIPIIIIQIIMITVILFTKWKLNN